MVFPPLSCGALVFHTWSPQSLNLQNSPLAGELFHHFHIWRCWKSRDLIRQRALSDPARSAPDSLEEPSGSPGQYSRGQRGYKGAGLMQPHTFHLHFIQATSLCLRPSSTRRREHASRSLHHHQAVDSEGRRRFPAAHQSRPQWTTPLVGDRS